MNLKNLILVEPICRGSRTQILSYFIDSIKDKYENIYLITRPDYNDDYFKEVIGNNIERLNIITTNVKINGWSKILSNTEFKEYLNMVDKIKSTIGCSDFTLVFMALDEYLIPYLKYFNKIRNFSSNIYVIKYRVEYLLYSPKNIKGIVLKYITKASIFFTKAKLFVFDERFSNNADEKFDYKILPDPWEGAFSPKQREKARKKYNFKEDDFVLLTIGKQDRRKGFDFLLSSMIDLLKINKVKLLIVGKIEGKYKNDFELFHKENQSIIHIDDFVSEEELPYLFGAADIILLPYNIDFTSSSGVLARAAASGTTVISTSHGLVGSRVKSWNLGEVFEYNHKKEFIEKIIKIKNYDKFEIETKRKGLKEFANYCSVLSFKKSVRKNLEPLKKRDDCF